MYYNKAYFTEEDVKSYNQMLEVAEKANKKVAMEWSSGWYLYSFFGNTGLTLGLNDDMVTNYCNWNSTSGEITGVDVANGMLALSASSALYNTGDDGILSGVKDGTVIAAVSGVWNANAIEETWGKNYGAVKLPTYTVAGQEIQMSSYAGYKMIGVNAYSKNKEWAAKMALWITNEENQTLRFVQRGQGPSNINAANSEEVQSSLAIQALLEQSQYASLQRVGEAFWTPSGEFGTTLAEHSDVKNVQKLLDTMVKSITANLIEE